MRPPAARPTKRAATRAKKTIGIVGSFDTKGHEAAYLRRLIARGGFDVVTVDVGTGMWGNPPFRPDVRREAVAAAGGTTIPDVMALAKAGRDLDWMTSMARGAAGIVGGLHADGRLHGIVALGGTMGTTLGCLVMASLPFGVPKVMYSTVASGNTRPYVGTKDICMIPSIADIAGLNRVTQVSLQQAAGAVMGMVRAGRPKTSRRPLVAITEIGKLVHNGHEIRRTLEQYGCEVILFHAVGTGGRAMEEMIDAGEIQGVCDISINEVMDHLHGGFCDAGPARMEAAARRGIPAVIAPGYVNRVVFTVREAIPEKFARRNINVHGSGTYLVPVTADELRELGRVVADKINLYRGPTTVLLPLRGFSFIDAIVSDFHDPEANRAFFEELRAKLKPGIRVKELDMHILDAAFASVVATEFLELSGLSRSRPGHRP